MSCGELAAARRSGLGVAVIVLDDDALSLIEVKQRRRGLAIHGTRLANGGDLGAPAHYFGVPVVAVGDADGLAQALSAALAAEGPTVIQARVDPAHYLATVCD
jgi:acetolactate synthase-1/2/3 large subunit